MSALPFEIPPAGDAPRVETLEYRTALAIARDGTEQRIAMRAKPRLSVSATYIVDDLLLPVLTHLRAGGSVLLPLHHERSLTTRVAPLVEATLSGDYSAESRTHTVHTIQIQLDATQPYTPSPLASLGGPLTASKSLAHNYAAALKALLATDADEFDAGHVRQRAIRYQKRGCQLEISLMSRAQIDEFRSFFCAVKGACEEFIWTAPGDEKPRLWRFGSDRVSINHRTAEYATASVSAIYVGERA